MSIINSITSWVMRKRIHQMELFMKYPIDSQQEVFQNLINVGRHSRFGEEHNFSKIRTIKEFQEQVPIRTYEQLYPYIGRVFEGEEDVLWPGEVKWFSKSSGTTNDKSKYIPVTKDSLQECHFKAGKDLTAIYLENKPESQMFSGRVLSLAGSHQVNDVNPKSSFGDISAVIVENLPIFFELFRSPSKKIALMPEWEQKLNVMTREVLDKNITTLAGVPSWILVLINKMFDLTGNTSKNLLDIWPNLEVFFHGGVNFEPYRKQFNKLIPSNSMNYVETYNASEGFFGIQNDLEVHDMLLMLDYGIFYEFIPLDELGKEHPKALTLEEVDKNTTYALVVSTNGGLWRYMVGDTIRFTETGPFKIKIAGRTKLFINAFGEELMIENVEQAMSLACEKANCVVNEFTVAPEYFCGGRKWSS